MTAYGTTHIYAMQLVQEKKKSINITAVKSHKVDKTARCFDITKSSLYRKTVSPDKTKPHLSAIYFALFVSTYAWTKLTILRKYIESKSNLSNTRSIIHEYIIKIILIGNSQWLQSSNKVNESYSWLEDYVEIQFALSKLSTCIPNVRDIIISIVCYLYVWLRDERRHDEIRSRHCSW